MSELMLDMRLRDVVVKYGKFPGPIEIEMARALYELGQDDEREANALAMEEMAMKYAEVVRWALNKGAQIIRDRVGNVKVTMTAECSLGENWKSSSECDQRSAQPRAELA